MESKAEQFTRDGYIVLDNFFNEDELDLAWKEVAIKATGDWRLATHPSKKEDGSLEEEASYNTLRAENHNESIQKIGEATEAAKTSTKMCYVFVRTYNPQVDNAFRALVLSKIDLISEITGEPLNGFYSAFTSCYEQGCFLSPHTDEFVTAEHRPNIAFALNITKEWRWEWGGLLHLFDKSPWDNGEVIKVVKPCYNSLVLFKLPRWHYVSEVAGSAAAKRLAFSGWLNFTQKIPETP